MIASISIQDPRNIGMFCNDLFCRHHHSGHIEALREAVITLSPWVDVENLCFNSFSATKIRNIHGNIWISYITSSVEDR